MPKAILNTKTFSGHSENSLAEWCKTQGDTAATERLRFSCRKTSARPSFLRAVHFAAFGTEIPRAPAGIRCFRTFPIAVLPAAHASRPASRQAFSLGCRHNFGLTRASYLQQNLQQPRTSSARLRLGQLHESLFDKHKAFLHKYLQTVRSFSMTVSKITEN